MTDDIVDRLRREGSSLRDGHRCNYRFAVDEAADEIARLRSALREIAANGYLGVKGRGFCHPEGCESPGIAQKALRPAYQPNAATTDED